MLRSIRSRLTAWYTLIVAVIFVVIAVVTYKYVSTTLFDTLDAAVINEAKWINQRLERQKVNDEPDDVVQRDLLEHTAFYPLKQYVEVWTPGGHLFFRTSNIAKDSLAKHVGFHSDTRWNLSTVTTFGNHPVRILMQDSPYGKIFVAMPFESVEDTLSQLIRVMAWMGPLVVFLALAGGHFLAKKSLAKVDQVTETARRISADRLHTSIPAHDVDDEIGRLTATFNGMIGRLNSSFEQMRQFSTDASHELRTPLTVMRSQLESALASRISASEMKKVVAQCLDEAIRMGSILENLLLLGREDEGHAAVRSGRVRLDDLLRDTYEESIILAAQKSIDVRIENSENILIWGDKQRLRQMLLNLVDNAIKYSNEKSTITLSLSAQNGEARVVVKDQGIGIPKSEISRIFDRFYRVDRARSRTLGGSGLGLAIVKWIVDAHGGSIAVRSTINKGSEFTVTLPVAKK